MRITSSLALLIKTVVASAALTSECPANVESGARPSGTGRSGGSATASLGEHECDPLECPFSGVCCARSSIPSSCADT